MNDCNRSQNYMENVHLLLNDFDIKERERESN